MHNVGGFISTIRDQTQFAGGEANERIFLIVCS